MISVTRNAKEHLIPVMERHIFFDPSGRRWPAFKRLLMSLALLTSILGAVLCVTVLLLPASPAAGIYRDAIKSFILKRDTRTEATRAYLAAQAKQKLLRKIAGEGTSPARRGHVAAPGHAYTTTVGFYVNWDPNSFNSFRAHLDALSYVMPEWLSLSEDTGLYTSSFSTQTRDPEVVSLAAHANLPVLPVLNNANETDFQWAPLRRLLTDPARQTALAAQLARELTAQHFAGINIDFEPPYDSMSNAEQTAAKALLRTSLPQFIGTLKQAFAPAHLLVTQDLPADDDNFAYSQLAKLNDFVVLMLYDQHTPSDDPGPIAGQAWFEEMANKRMAGMDPAKVVLGLGNYCYDWPINIDAQGNITRTGAGQELQIGPALNLARESGAEMQMDAGDLNPYFTYQDTAGHDHIVYLLDAATVYNELHALQPLAPRGAALWYLGAEDPALWSFFDEDTLAKPVQLSALSTVDFKSTMDIDTNRSGDELMLLSAKATPGTRHFTTDANGLITSERYAPYPVPYIVRQFDTAAKTVALTFDDGPDPKYTPQILRVLETQGVPATFFVIGKQVASYPDIVRRAWRDGDELGNHTYTHPHIAQVSPLQAALEVNATQRIIESITGHMTLLFRPPYGELPDSGTVIAEDLPLLLQMQHDGYVIVGMNIDPQDFTKPGVPAIVRAIDQQLKNNHIILLHDGGGDRAQTVAALPEIIRDLQARGYRFVTVSGLMGPGWHDKLFPPVSRRQGQIAGLDYTLFEIGYFFSAFLHGLFLVAIFLGVARIVLFGILAVRHARQDRATMPKEDYTPEVTVAIPAYNEAKVICRTIASVLAGDYPALRVIVVDDGSADDTAAVARARFGADPRATILRQENGGKSTALNNAFALAATEIVVCLDADTEFTPQTIRRLVQPFQDPRVGAVAGNVKVGNRVNLLANWQSLEYITSQNFDRRAFAALNAVPVVPGAVGAWRRSVVQQVGGFETDTLAEDTDLTFKVRLAGYHTRCQNTALAYTEAPDSLGTLAKQRSRWAFGILQALWKHKHQLGQPRHGVFSQLVMPSMWVFSIFLQALAPVVDLTVLLALFNGQLGAVLFYGAAFFVLDLFASLLAFRLDREDPRQLVWLFWQRLFYREFLYYIILKAITAALRGGLVGWGKLQRKATVTLPSG